ncbi:hypothetical protein K3495_g5323 [Podosphaera aphanis]|nr:hypothetical protein K3495_g5323 [Podosphaera aphanis]
MSDMTDNIYFPTGFRPGDIVSWGNSGLVCLDRASQTVVKFPHGEENKDEIAVEQKIYERLHKHGGYEGLLRYHGPYETGIRLEFACNGDLRSFLKKRANDIKIEQRLLWAQQIAESICFVHSIDIIHGDLTSDNILLDAQLNTRLCDFAGSSLDGCPLLVAVQATHHCPGSALSIQGDVFALGSTLYEVMTGVAPYHQYSEREVERKFSRHEFPDTKLLGPIGAIITQCWLGQYSNFEVIIRDIRAV